jgi:endonuclease I
MINPKIQKQPIMLKINLLPTFIVLFSMTLSAQVPNGYYSTAQGLRGENLKTELHEIIKGHNARTYDQLWTDIQSTDDKSNGKVWDMYSDNPDGTPPYEFTFVDDQCGNYGTEGDCYNREHSFPKSWFNDNNPMYTDLFHIYPTDGYVNGRRLSYPYGETSNADWTSQNGSKLGPCSVSGYSGKVFEPIDEYKGDFARTYFYTVTRYENNVANWENNSTYADAVLNGTKHPAFEEWVIDMFLQWHDNDPVSQKEIDRNNEVYDIQNNRNPFIDHPEYVDKIWGDPSQNTKPSINNIETKPSFPDSSDNVFITASITDRTGSIVNAQANWSFTKDNLSNTISMADKGEYYQTKTSIPKQKTGTTIYYQVSATDDSSTTSTSNIKTYTVKIQPDTILSEKFSSCPLENWTTKSISGSEDWTCASGYMQINAYGSDAACDDWLITPKLNLNDYKKDTLRFETWTKYTDNYYPPLEVKYSKNYTSGDDPSSADWKTIACTLSPEDSETWTKSDKIDLTEINSDNVHIAFHYTSSGTNAGSSASWKLDNVHFTGKHIADTSTFIKKLPQVSLLKIYPNPARNIIYIDSQDPTQIYQVSLYTITGKIIRNNNYPKPISRRISIKTNSVSRGTYIIKIKTSQKIIYKKIMVQ